MRRGLVAGTVLSLIVAGPGRSRLRRRWARSPPLHLSWHHPVASYLALASAPTGNGGELFAVGR